MIYDAAFWPNPAVAFEDVNDQPRAFEFIFQMRRVDQNELIVFGGHIDVHLQNFQLVSAVLVQTDFADSKHIGLVQELGDDGKNIFGELHVFGFLRIDAKPGEMQQAEFRRALRFVLGQLAKIIEKAIDRTPVEAGPERWFTDGLAAGRGHIQVIVGHPANHVTMWFDVSHLKIMLVGVLGLSFCSRPGTGSSFGRRHSDRLGCRVAQA